MIINEMYFLDKIYTRLKSTLILLKKYKQESVLFSFYQITTNGGYEVLDQSSINANEIPKEILMNYLRNGYIRPTDKIEKFAITGKGVWAIESEINNLSVDDLIKFNDLKFFNLFGKKRELDGKEKVILLAMLGSRCFSKQSAVDILTKKQILDSWKDIIDYTQKFLIENNILGTNINLYINLKANEHAVSKLFHHTGELLKKTKGIYKAPGQRKYYLEVLMEDSQSNRNISYLFWLIFGKKINQIGESTLVNYLRTIAYDKIINIQNPSMNKYLNMRYDKPIIESFREAIKNVSLWEEVRK